MELAGDAAPLSRSVDGVQLGGEDHDGVDLGDGLGLLETGFVVGREF